MKRSAWAKREAIHPLGVLVIQGAGSILAPSITSYG